MGQNVRIEIEFDEQGEIVGSIPPVLAAFIERKERAAYGQGSGKGKQKAAEDAKKQILESVEAQLAKSETPISPITIRWGELQDRDPELASALNHVVELCLLRKGGN
jgi:hypothetical protein